MARREGREPRGGRSRATAPDPAHAATDLAPLSLLDELLGPLEEMTFESPLEVELFGSFVLSVLTADEPDLLDSMIGFLAEHAALGARLARDALRLFATLAPPPSADRAAAALAESASRAALPRWADSLGRAVVESAQVLEHETGDGFVICLRLRHPGAGAAHVIGVYIDVNLGGLAKDLMVFPDADEYVRLFLAGDRGMSTRALPLAEARGRIAHALWITDRTIDAPVTDDFVADRFLLDHYLALVPDEGYADDAEPLADDERERLVNEFLSSTEGTSTSRAVAPIGVELLRNCARVAVDYATDHTGGDPMRWTASVVESFLYWVPLRVSAPVEQLERVPEFLRSFVPFAHRRKGWDHRYLDDALDAITAFEAEYRAALEDADTGAHVSTRLMMSALLAGVDLNDPDTLRAFVEQRNKLAAVQHPEPMNWQGIKSGVRPGIEEILAEIEVACDQALDDEYLTLARRLTATLARKRPSPLSRGRAGIWAGAIVYALAQINWLFTSETDPSMAAGELTRLFDGSHSAIVNKARDIRSLCKLDAFPPPAEYTRAELLW